VKAGADGLGEGVQNVQEAGSHVWEQTKAGISDAAGRLRAAGRATSDMRTNTQERMSRFIDQQPLAAAAVGLAAGALLGLILPGTKAESEYLGDVADQARGKAMETGGQLYEKGKLAAAEAYRSAVRTEPPEHGNREGSTSAS
jgi:ElaB/YqjD/DUF883 family membrane-anchored ribosome-binding protein